VDSRHAWPGTAVRPEYAGNARLISGFNVPGRNPQRRPALRSLSASCTSWVVSRSGDSSPRGSPDFPLLDTREGTRAGPVPAAQEIAFLRNSWMSACDRNRPGRPHTACAFRQGILRVGFASRRVTQRRRSVPKPRLGNPQDLPLRRTAPYRPPPEEARRGHPADVPSSVTIRP
jgi:hypothetical protein